MITGSALGFKSVILSDLIENSTALQTKKNKFLKVAGLLFARVITSKDVLKMIREQTAKSKYPLYFSFFELVIFHELEQEDLCKECL